MPELVAVVDLGSTAVRLLLARIVPGAGYRVLVEERVPTRLGGGTADTLPADAIADTLRAVHRFFARYSAKRRGPRVVAVATSAVRDARNRECLLGPLRRLEGIEVQILSARDEARLGVDAALNRLRFKHGIVADLGGASLQISRVRDRRVVSSASLPLGAVRTTRRFLRHDPPRPRELRAIGHEVRSQLQNAVPPAARRRGPGRSRAAGRARAPSLGRTRPAPRMQRPRASRSSGRPRSRAAVRAPRRSVEERRMRCAGLDSE